MHANIIDVPCVVKRDTLVMVKGLQQLSVALAQSQAAGSDEDACTGQLPRSPLPGVLT
jgi:hypothetical protein